MVLVLFALAMAMGLYVLLPALPGLGRTWSRIAEGDPRWLVAAACFELISFASYVVAFRFACGDGPTLLGWRQSYRITMAGVVATRLLAAGGAGGITLTAWALARQGMARTEVASRVATLLVLLYGVFMAAIMVTAVGLTAGVLPGPNLFGLTMIPAIFAAVVVLIALAAGRWSRDPAAVAADLTAASGSTTNSLRTAIKLAPATLSAGVQGSLALVRGRSPALLGAVGWWAFDIATLAAALKAFGGSPQAAVVVMAYFVGLLANLVPLPGGVGAVEGGMIGALIAFGVDGGLAIAGVLTYRLFAFWLPILPGTVAYVSLLRGERE